MVDDLPPDWAMQRAGKLSGYKTPLHTGTSWWWNWAGTIAFARLIAKHEQPPVDPLMIEARELAANLFEVDGSPATARMVRAGGSDDFHAVQSMLRALRRGMEIQKERG